MAGINLIRDNSSCSHDVVRGGFSPSFLLAADEVLFLTILTEGLERLHAFPSSSSSLADEDAADAAALFRTAIVRDRGIVVRASTMHCLMSGNLAFFCRI